MKKLRLRVRMTLRCWLLLAAVFGTTTGLLAQTTTWTGGVSTAWNTPGNWSAGVPTVTLSVVIPSAPANQPVLSTTAVAKSVELRSGASLSITASGSLTLNGSTVIGSYTTAFYNRGTVTNRGQLTIGNTAWIGQYGLWNTATFINTGEGIVTIDRTSTAGLYNEVGGSFTNTAQLILGAIASLGTYGLHNQATFNNNTEGVIAIQRASFYSLYNQGGSFTNVAQITLGTTASVGDYGLYNQAAFRNNTGGVITIDQADYAGLYNVESGNFTNAAQITIGAAAPVGELGLFNVGIFANNSGGTITVDKAARSGLSNGIGGDFTNAAQITLSTTASGQGTGLSNSTTFRNNPGGVITVNQATSIGLSNSGTFTNLAHITLGATGPVGFWGVLNDGSFNNSGCEAFLNIVADAVITDRSEGTLTNSGTIIENASTRSNMATNSGLVRNLNRGSFDITTNIGVLTTTPGGSGITLTATPSLTINQDQSATLTADGAKTYRWSSGQTTSSISVSATGTYSVTGTTGSCSSVTSVAVSVRDVAVGGLAATPSSVCVGVPVTFTATVSNVTGSYAYTLTNGTDSQQGTSSNPIFSQTVVAGSSTSPQPFTLTVSSAGVRKSATVLLMVKPLPTASFSGLTATYCANASPVNLVPVTAGGTFSGPGISGTTFTPSSGGSGGTITYSVIVNGCTNTSTQNVTITPLPTASIAPASVTLTCASPGVSLTASGGTTYRWEDNSTNAVRSILTPGTYSVTVTSSSGCSATASRTISSNTAPLTASISPASATLTCISPSVSLTASGGVTYRWEDNSTNAVCSVTTAGTYSVTVTSANGCSATASRIIAGSGSLPTVSISPASQTIAAGQSITFTASGATSYTWSTGHLSNSLVVFPTSNTVYSVVGTSGSCSAMARANVVIRPEVSLAAIGGSSCAGVASLSVNSSSTIHRVDWYRGTTLLSTSLPRAATTGVTVAGGNGIGSAANQFSYAHAVFVDASGAVYATDQFNHRVQKWASGATSGVTVAGGNGRGAAANQLDYPEGVWVDAFGAVYVADYNNHRIQKWAPGATSGVTVAGGNGLGAGANQLSYPTGVSVDGSGAIYVADRANQRIQKWNFGATTGTTVAGGNGQGDAANQFDSPYGLWVDDSGVIYVADVYNHRIQKWVSGAGSGVTVAGGNGQGTGANQLRSPLGVSVDAFGAVYVADQFNDRIQKWVPGASSGVTVAGDHGNGSAPNQLNLATGVYVDGTGAIYVADNSNHRIQKWVPGAVLSTYSPTSAGIYSAKVTGTDTYTITTNAVTVIAPPTVNASPALSTITIGQPVTITASGATSYTWSTGQTGASISVSPMATTIYSVIGTTGGCSDITSATVVVPPTASLSNTGPGACVSVASLSISSAATIRQVDWYLDNTIVATSLPQATTIGVTVAGGNGSGSAANQLARPYKASVDGLGAVYVADGDNQRIQKWAPGATSGVTVAGGNGFGAGANQLSYPLGLYVESSGGVYIADVNNHRIQKWLPGASAGITVAGGNGAGSAANQLNSPSGVFVDAAGAIYVTDEFNYRVQKWVPGATSGITVAGGNGQGSAASQLNLPGGLFVDGTGAVYIADQANSRVQKWAPGASSGVTVAGGNGSGSAANQLSNPSDVFVDASGMMYVVDQGRHRIQKFPPNSTSTTSGTTVAGGNGQGSGANQLNDPTGLYVAASGALYIADTDNHRIQQWGPDVVNLTHTPIVAGSYSAKITDIYGYTATTNAISLTTLPLSISPASPGITAGQSVTLTASGATSYSWSTGQTGNSLVVTPTTTTTYSVTGTTGICTAVMRVQVTVLSAVRLTNAGPGACVGVSSLSVTSSLPISQLDWYNGTILVATGLPQAVTAGVTVAGGNGSGTAANQLNRPVGVHVDVFGAVYVADAINNRIQKWIPGTTTGITVAGGNGAGSAANQLNQPFEVRVDAAGAIYVADWSNHRIQKWAPGATSGVTVAGGNGFGAGANQFNGPNGLYVDAAGTVYVADWGNHRIQKWTPGATSGVTVAGGNGSGNGANQLSFPSSVYVDGSGAVYVADYNNHRIQKWAVGAIQGVTIAGGNGQGAGSNQFNQPTSVWVDTFGFVYVADRNNHRIQKFPPNSSQATSGTTVAGGNGAGVEPNQLNQPYSVYVTEAGAIYATDRNNHRIQRWESATVTPVYSPITAGSYTAKVTDLYGYAVITNAVAVSAPPVVSIEPDSQTITMGQSATLTASGATSYTWSTGQTENSVVVAPTTATVYSVTGTTSGCSATASAGLFVNPLQADLAMLLYAQPSTVSGTSTISLVADVFELNTVSTNGTITIYITKDPLLNLTFNPAATLIGNRLVQNSNWSFDARNNPSFYVLTTAQSTGADGKLSVGLSGQLTSGNTKGNLSISALVEGSAVGEIQLINNADAERIDYFNK